MSRTHMVVLGFLHEAPMYGYKIGQIVDSKHFPVWSGIKVASVYKAMQSLHRQGYIDGEQVMEGNSPPRTVYHINAKGRKRLTQLVTKFLEQKDLPGQEFWIGLSFARGIFTRRQFQKILHSRIKAIRQLQAAGCSERCQELVDAKKIPVIHRHMVSLADKWSAAETEVLEDLLGRLNTTDYDDFFKE